MTARVIMLLLALIGTLHAQQPVVSTTALHTDEDGRLVQPFTVPAGTEIVVEPGGAVRWGGVSGYTMRLDPIDAQMEWQWPASTMAFYPHTGTVEFNGIVRATAFQGPFEGTVTLADSEAVVFGAHQITSGTLSYDRLPWPGGALFSGLPTGPPLNEPRWLRWMAETGLDYGTFAYRTAADTKSDLGMITASTSLDWPSIGAGAASTLTITVPGATTTGTPSVHLGWSAALPVGILLAQAWVSGANTVSIRLSNASTEPIDPAATTVRATVHLP